MTAEDDCVVDTDEHRGKNGTVRVELWRRPETVNPEGWMRKGTDTRKHRDKEKVLVVLEGASSG